MCGQSNAGHYEGNLSKKYISICYQIVRLSNRQLTNCQQWHRSIWNCNLGLIYYLLWVSYTCLTFFKMYDTFIAWFDWVEVFLLSSILPQCSLKYGELSMSIQNTTEGAAVWSRINALVVVGFTIKKDFKRCFMLAEFEEMNV